MQIPTVVAFDFRRFVQIRGDHLPIDVGYVMSGTVVVSRTEIFSMYISVLNGAHTLYTNGFFIKD